MKLKTKNKIITAISISALTVVLATFFSCDKVKHPDQHPDVYVDCKMNAPVVKTNSLTSGFRKVLVEDYTGHYCGNCPRAAETVTSLVQTYHDNVVIMACHVSKTYAAPKTDTTYREDFRDATSTEWDNFFGISGTGLPKGMVNRTSPYPQNYNSWSTLVSAGLAKPQVAKLDITSTYDVSQKLLNVKVKTTFLKTLTDTVYLSIGLTQDSIFADQEDYTPPAGCQTAPGDPSRRINYLFDNVFIGSLNGTWGDLVKRSPQINDTLTLNRNCYVLNKCFYKSTVCINDNHVNVVAFIYSNTTKEVLQVEKLKIR
jgi:thiol-disulfide isomerase/thioredoxin